MVTLTMPVSNMGPAASSSHQVGPRAVTHRGVTARVVQVGVWELPMVLEGALLIDGMSALLLIIFMAASSKHVQSSGFSGWLFPCLSPAVMLQAQSVVCVLTKNLELSLLLLPA